MKCVLCGQRSPIEAKIDQFPLSERARKMLARQLAIDIADHALLENGVCRQCLALPFAERMRLAESAIEKERDEDFRGLIRHALLKGENSKD